MIFWIVLFTGVFLIGELLRKMGIPVEVTRKFSHFTGGMITLVLPFVLPIEQIILLGAMFTVLLFLSYKLNFLKSINSVNRSTLGSPLFPAAGMLAAILTYPKPLAFQVAVLILAVSDTMTWALFSKSVKLGKTVAGSAFFGLVTFLVWLLIGYFTGRISIFYILITFMFSALISGIEYYSHHGSDNLLVTLTSAALAFVIF